MSEEDKIQKFFRAYFTENKIKEDFAQKIIERAQQFQAKQKPKEFLGRFFDALKKSYDPKNPKSLVNACKRFLFVISKLLGDGKKQKQGRYPEIISSQIVQYYLFFFEIIFKNHLHELTVDLKMCRMRWVKLISDSAFAKLRQEIMRKHKFNLDKGFSQENLQKIRKIHKRRGLSEKESNFYLGLQVNEEFKVETPKRQDTRHQQNSQQSSSESSDEDYKNGTKKQKIDYVQPFSTIPNNPMYPTYDTPSGYNPMIPSSRYENPSYMTYSDPRFYRSQNVYPYNPSQIPSSYHAKEISYDQTPKTNVPKYPFSQSTNPQTLLYPYQNFPKPYEVNQIPTPYEFRQVKEVKQLKKSDSFFQKIKKIRQELQKNLIKCRQCGQFFENGQNHDKHMTQHFFASLEKVNQAQVKGKIKKQNKLKLLDFKTWQNMEKSEQTQYRFEVLLSELSQLNNDKKLCFFCNEELQISFSTKYEDWVYCNAVKIDDQGTMGVIHFNCYQCFKSDQNSPEENGKQI